MITNNIKQLNGKFIKLIPMEADHRAELLKLLHNPQIWEYTFTENNNNRTSATTNRNCAAQ